MKTQTANITPRDGTVNIAGEMNLIVHTGTVKVTVTTQRALFHERYHIQLHCTGLYYTTATVEAKDGSMEALTDPRAQYSPFAEGWR